MQSLMAEPHITNLLYHPISGAPPSTPPWWLRDHISHIIDLTYCPMNGAPPYTPMMVRSHISLIIDLKYLTTIYISWWLGITYHLLLISHSALWVGHHHILPWWQGVIRVIWSEFEIHSFYNLSHLMIQDTYLKRNHF